MAEAALGVKAGDRTAPFPPKLRQLRQPFDPNSVHHATTDAKLVRDCVFGPSPVQKQSDALIMFSDGWASDFDAAQDGQLEARAASLFCWIIVHSSQQHTLYRDARATRSELPKLRNR